LAAQRGEQFFSLRLVVYDDDIGMGFDTAWAREGGPMRVVGTVRLLIYGGRHDGGIGQVEGMMRDFQYAISVKKSRV